MFNVTYAETKLDALTLLSRTSFDCAVVDLRLPDASATEVASAPLGNDILKKLLEDIGIPTVVYSAYEGEASEAIGSSNIRVHTKQGGEGQQILASFAAQSGLMAAMKATRNSISKATALLFNQSIWLRWETRWAKEEDKQMITDVIARQTASHIADALAQATLNHHPDEFYVVPALYLNRVDTGDLFVIDGQVHVVLSPRCNMANKQPSHIVLAVCSPMQDWVSWRECFLTGNAKQREKAVKDMRSHASQGHGIATHFLPPLSDKGPWLVEFQEVRTIQFEDINALLPQRIASIAPHFIPNLVQRYSSYLGRIGQPDINPDILMALCKG
ncbi:hypothetical protein V2I59_00355 [Pseudomonas viridiflava]|uniref:hypothetical protein n=1 Tax=Pseudomonas viridiflava TaxID=33069 RepID=UPI0013CEBA68|nr:hypothetical protein [Pseudomonas viridiflava]MEE4091976.1 hypothetical protein [Pseudomonas viridiflava]